MNSEYVVHHLMTPAVVTETQKERLRSKQKYFFSLTLNIKGAFDMRLDEMGIDIIDLAIFDIFVRLMPLDSMQKVRIGNEEWVWLAHNKILSECPFLGIKKQRLADRIGKLCEVGLIKKHVDMTSGSRTLYRQGPIYENMIYGGGAYKSTDPSVLKYAGGSYKSTDNDSYSYDLNINESDPVRVEKEQIPSSLKASSLEEKEPLPAQEQKDRLYNWFYERLKLTGALPTDKAGVIALHKAGRASATAIEAQVGIDLAIKVYQWGFDKWYRSPSLSGWSQLKTDYDKAMKNNKSNTRRTNAF